MNKPNQIIVIGGGASGMVAAIAAGRKGARVLLLERMQRVGKKILATGNGRCNYTNSNTNILCYHGSHPGFASDTLRRFNSEWTLDFFRELGVEPRMEADGKFFPFSNQAGSILDVLRYEMEQLGVEVICEQNVLKLKKQGSGFLCQCADGKEFPACKVIITTGGRSAPNFGSNGGGYKIAEGLGHKIITPFPALVQVRLNAPFLKRLKGLRLDGEAELFIDNESHRKEKGELLFTDYGISGPPILQISRSVSQFSKSGKDLFIQLDLFPNWSQEELILLITRRIAANPGKPIDMHFIGFLHKRLIPVVLKEAHIEEIHSPCGELTEKEIRCMAALVKAWRIPCTGTQSWMDSQVTAGGVDVSQVDPHTMESKIVPGVFFAGEVLDVDGDCGGYNLQWAWASGHVAGESAAGGTLE